MSEQASKIVSELFGDADQKTQAAIAIAIDWHGNEMVRKAALVSQKTGTDLGEPAIGFAIAEKIRELKVIANLS